MKKKYNSPIIEIIDIMPESDIALAGTSGPGDPVSGETRSINSGMHNSFDNSLFDNSSSPIYGDQD